MEDRLRRAAEGSEMMREAGEATQREKSRQLRHLFGGGPQVEMLSRAVDSQEYDSGEVASGAQQLEEEDLAAAALSSEHPQGSLNILTTQMIDDHVTSPSVSAGVQLWSESEASQKTVAADSAELRAAASKVKQEAEAAPEEEKDPPPMQLVQAPSLRLGPVAKREALEQELGPVAAAACNFAAGFVTQQLTGAHERELSRQAQWHQQELKLAVRLAKSEAENEVLRKQNETLLSRVGAAPSVPLPQVAALLPRDEVLEVKEEEAAQEEPPQEFVYRTCEMAAEPPYSVLRLFLELAYGQVAALDMARLPTAIEQQLRQFDDIPGGRLLMPGQLKSLLDLDLLPVHPEFLRLRDVRDFDVQVLRKQNETLLSRVGAAPSVPLPQVAALLPRDEVLEVKEEEAAQEEPPQEFVYRTCEMAAEPPYSVLRLFLELAYGQVAALDMARLPTAIEQQLRQFDDIPGADSSCLVLRKQNETLLSRVGAAPSVPLPQVAALLPRDEVLEVKEEEAAQEEPPQEFVYRTCEMAAEPPYSVLRLFLELAYGQVAALDMARLPTAIEQQLRQFDDIPGADSSCLEFVYRTCEMAAEPPYSVLRLFLELAYGQVAALDMARLPTAIEQQLRQFDDIPGVLRKQNETLLSRVGAAPSVPLPQVAALLPRDEVLEVKEEEAAQEEPPQEFVYRTCEMAAEPPYSVLRLFLELAYGQVAALDMARLPTAIEQQLRQFDDIPGADSSCLEFVYRTCEMAAEPPYSVLRLFLELAYGQVAALDMARLPTAIEQQLRQFDDIPGVLRKQNETLLSRVGAAPSVPLPQVAALLPRDEVLEVKEEEAAQEEPPQEFVYRTCEMAAEPPYSVLRLFLELAYGQVAALDMARLPTAIEQQLRQFDDIPGADSSCLVLRKQNETLLSRVGAAPSVPLPQVGALLPRDEVLEVKEEEAAQEEPPQEFVYRTCEMAAEPPYSVLRLFLELAYGQVAASDMARLPAAIEQQLRQFDDIPGADSSCLVLRKQNETLLSRVGAAPSVPLPQVAALLPRDEVLEVKEEEAAQEEPPQEFVYRTCEMAAEPPYSVLRLFLELAYGQVAALDMARLPTAIEQQLRQFDDIPGADSSCLVLRKQNETLLSRVGAAPSVPLPQVGALLPRDEVLEVKEEEAAQEEPPQEFVYRTCEMAAEPPYSVLRLFLELAYGQVAALDMARLPTAIEQQLRQFDDIPGADSSCLVLRKQNETLLSRVGAAPSVPLPQVAALLPRDEVLEVKEEEAAQEEPPQEFVYRTCEMAAEPPYSVLRLFLELAYGQVAASDMARLPTAIEQQLRQFDDIPGGRLLMPGQLKSSLDLDLLPVHPEFLRLRDVRDFDVQVLRKQNETLLSRVGAAPSVPLPQVAALLPRDEVLEVKEEEAAQEEPPQEFVYRTCEMAAEPPYSVLRLFLELAYGQVAALDMARLPTAIEQQLRQFDDIPGGRLLMPGQLKSLLDLDLLPVHPEFLRLRDVRDFDVQVLRKQNETLLWRVGAARSVPLPQVAALLPRDEVLEVKEEEAAQEEPPQEFVYRTCEMAAEPPYSVLRLFLELAYGQVAALDMARLPTAIEQQLRQFDDIPGGRLLMPGQLKSLLDLDLLPVHPEFLRLRDVRDFDVQARKYKTRGCWGSPNSPDCDRLSPDFARFRQTSGEGFARFRQISTDEWGEVPGHDLDTALHLLRESFCMPWERPNLELATRCREIRACLHSTLRLPQPAMLLETAATRIATALGNPDGPLGFVHIVCAQGADASGAKLLKLGKTSMSISNWLRGGPAAGLMTGYKNRCLIPDAKLQLLHVVLLRSDREAWELEQLVHGSMQKLHPGLVLRDASLWPRRSPRSSDKEKVPKLFETYLPEALDVLHACLGDMLAMSPDKRKELLRSNWRAWCHAWSSLRSANTLYPVDPCANTPLSHWAYRTVRNQEDWEQCRDMCFRATAAADWFRLTRGRVYMAYSKNLKQVYASKANHGASYVFPMYFIKFKDLPVDRRKQVMTKLKLKELMDKDPDLTAPGEDPTVRSPKRSASQQEAPPAAAKRRMQRPAAAHSD
ncbi:unnamed protein product [Symbiodinium sp. CCMP2592]|nr:unnamed protein product [Symbiodinium sp. CCMP2592]